MSVYHIITIHSERYKDLLSITYGLSNIYVFGIQYYVTGSRAPIGDVFHVTKKRLSLKNMFWKTTWSMNKSSYQCNRASPGYVCSRVVTVVWSMSIRLSWVQMQTYISASHTLRNKTISLNVGVFRTTMMLAENYIICDFWLQNDV